MASNPASLADARLQTAGGIRYKLVKQSLSITHDQATAQEIYLIRVQDIDDFCLESFPLPTFVGLLFFPGWPRKLPGNPYLLTKQVDIEGLTDELPTDMWRVDTGAPAGTYQDIVKATITYEAKPSEDNFNPQDPVTWLKHSVTTGGEFLCLSPKNTKWESSGDMKDFHTPITKILPTIEHSLDWSYVLYPPWTTIRNYLGTVNDAVIPLFNNAPEETVLFTSLTGDQSYTLQGAMPWNLSYKFSERHITEGSDDQIGWNHVYNPSTGKFEKLLRQNPDDSEDDGRPLYESNNFLNLFQAELPA